MILTIYPTMGANCWCFYRQPTLRYPKVGDYLVRDHRIWNLKVKARTRDTNLDRFELPK
jgi:hypothetical protein